MVAYSFRPRFVNPILVGLGMAAPNSFGVTPPEIVPKRQTIRADRARHARPGEELQLYCGMRTKGCFLIGRARCVRVAPVSLSFLHNMEFAKVKGSTYARSWKDRDRFAQNDGFRNWEEMREFWRVENDADAFEGVIIKWEPLP